MSDELKFAIVSIQCCNDKKYIEKQEEVSRMVKHKAFQFIMYPNTHQEILINETYKS